MKGAVVMNKDKIEELIAASKLNELLHKKDVEESKKKSNVIIIVLAVIGAVAALAAIVYAIYRYFTPANQPSSHITEHLKNHWL